MANITRYNPFSEMVSLHDAMDRLFEDSFVSPLSWRPLNGEAMKLTPFTRSSNSVKVFPSKKNSASATIPLTRIRNSDGRRTRSLCELQS